MKNTIDNFINSKELNNGLLLADLPTGYGKTYTAARSIYDYVSRTGKGSKVFFITTMIKNLPVDELKNAYREGGDPDGYEKDVLVIKSNFDFIREKILKVNVPDRYKTTAYFNLCEKIKLFNTLDSRNDRTSKLFKASIEKEIRENLEKNFRKEIQDIIRKELPKKVSERRYRIRHNSDYQWIAEIYPTVFMNDYKVFLLTVDKFLVKNTTLVEPSYDFIQNSITDNAIIFIDEFDATKETIQKAIIKNALDSQDDYIKLFEQIYKAIQLHEFPISMMRPYQDYLHENNSSYTFESLLMEASKLYTVFNLKYSYKTVSESVDRKQSFLFNDNSYHTMLRNNCNYIRITPDEVDKQVKIYFENKQDYYQNRSKSDIVVYALIRGINSFLTKFKILIFNWASMYADAVNMNRKDDADEFTTENSMRTIYREFALSQRQIQLLMGDLCGGKIINTVENLLIPDMSFYNNGFKYFEFADSDEHLSQTIFNYVKILDTPEKIMLYLSNKAKVVGISATATLPTVVGNYDIEYFSKQLKNNFVLASSDVYEEIGKDLKERWKAYTSGDIHVNVNVLDYNMDNLSLDKRLKDIFEDKDFAYKYYNRISLMVSGNKYLWKRYCNIFMAFKEFIKHDDINSFLCLNMVLPQTGKNSFNLDLLKDAMNDLIEVYGNAETLSAEQCLSVLKSDNFEEEKEDVLNRLSKGEKIFLLSSYKTIGAGQNLQYKIEDINDFIQTYQPEDLNDIRIKSKDMDALFLGDITNIAVNTFNVDKFDKEDMLKFFFQIEYLYENDEINYGNLSRLIKLGFKTYSGSIENDLPALQKLTKARSILEQVTRDVMQAVGRICRTYIKNSNIYVYTVEELINKIDVDCLKGKLLSPEMKEIVRAKKDFGCNYTEQEELILNKAERISSIGKNFIMRMLSRDWNFESMRLWKELRNTVLSYLLYRKKNTKRMILFLSFILIIKQRAIPIYLHKKEISLM